MFELVGSTVNTGRLERVGALLHISGDGNCLFASLADQLWRAPEQHERLRGEIVREMLERPSLYGVSYFMVDPVYPDGVPLDATYDQYVRNHLSRPRVWGNHFCIQAFCNMYRAAVHLVSKSTISQEMLFEPDPTVAPQGAVAHAWLFWTRGRHYDSLRLEPPIAGVTTRVDPEQILEDIKRRLARA